VIRIGITGADGFIGWHLRAFLHGDGNVKTVPAGRHVFADPEKLREFAGGVDVIVHLAGANRGDDQMVRATNIALAEQLVAACEAAGAAPHVLFASTTHYTRASAYGESKRIAAEKFSAWAAKSGALFTSLVLPHVFGEGSRPFYNSAVATFCHQLAHGKTPRIIEDRELELLHVQRLTEKIRTAISDAQGGDIRLHGAPLRVSELLSALQEMARQYGAHTIPELESPLKFELFNSFRWYLFPQRYPIGIELRHDERGAAFEAVKTLRGGQCMLYTIRPGMTRGNHYHRRKLERLLVLRGAALIRVRRLLDGDVTEFRVSGDRPQFVDLPTLHTHNITNTGAADLTTLTWSQEIYDAAFPDTFPETV
jgi:UDP-2-acetamido-2,6-beta-L-arabino-hexul-4-ose reductase